MTISLKELGLDKLSAEEKLAVIRELWDSFPIDSAEIPLTNAQREELDRRIADHEANPQDVVPWAEVRESVRSRIDK